MGFLEKLRSTRGRSGWTGRHLIDPHGKPIAADSGNREGRHQHRGQKQKRKDFHAPAARPSICVVASGGHAVSHSLEFWNWTASGPLPCGTLSGEPAAALIWIKPPANRGPESSQVITATRAALAVGGARRREACFVRRNSPRLDSAPLENTLRKTTNGSREIRHEIRHLL